jgi:HPt (histidine-containing phosphotransfer) domain-containing protein
MKDILDEALMPGLEKVRVRFLIMLEDRQCQIANHALTAWDGDSVDVINGNLKKAQDVLHKIAGSSGSLGFHALGDAARDCEHEVIAHLEGPYADLALCPPGVIHQMDRFIAMCAELIAENRQEYREVTGP